MYIDYYGGKKAMPLVVDIFNKCGIETTEEHVKIWSMPHMRYSDVMTGCDYCSRTGKSHLIYTNKVDDMIKREALVKHGIVIFDITNVIDMAGRADCLKIYDYIHENYV